MADVLVTVAHPDDETLGCGATLARLTSRGHRVQVLVVADGERGRPEATDASVAERQAAARAAAVVLGTQPPRFLDLPDQALETLPRLEITRAIEALAEDFAPDVVLTHDGNDLNLDHRVVHDATVTAFRPLAGRPWATLCTFETPSASEYGALAHGSAFNPNLFVDVTDHFDAKLEAMACYRGEQRPAPHPRHPDSLTALATVRGAACGLARAEGFNVVFARGPVVLTD